MDMSFQIRGKVMYIDKFRHTDYVPEEVGNFAISADGDFAGCDTTTYPTMKTNPSPPFDLSVGYDPVTFGALGCGTTFPNWEKILKWVTGSKQGYSKMNEVQVVTQRGILKDIGYTNHDNFKNPWTFEACKFEGKVYIRKANSAYEYKTNWNKKNTYWSMKFRDYMIDSDPKLKSCYKVIKAKIGNTEVLFSAVIDGVDTNSGDPDHPDHVDVKTCGKKPHELKNNLSNAWIQSFLGDIQCLYYGIKGEDGIIRSVPTKIPMSSREVQLRDKDKDSMMGLLSKVLEWLCGSLRDENAMWFMKYAGNSSISLKKSGEKFLPEWYLDGDDMLVRAMQAL